MTIKRAERLTGYEIHPLPPERDRVCFGAFDGEKPVAKASGLVEWQALKELVHRMYLLHSRVCNSTAGAAACCRSRRPLQVHHRKYRSHGGTHEVSNLEPVCWDCHRVIHARERSQ